MIITKYIRAALARRIRDSLARGDLAIPNLSNSCMTSPENASASVMLQCRIVGLSISSSYYHARARSEGSMRRGSAPRHILNRAVEVANSYGLRTIWTHRECLPQHTHDSSQIDKDEQEHGLQAMGNSYSRVVVAAGMLNTRITSQDQPACDAKLHQTQLQGTRRQPRCRTRPGRTDLAKRNRS
jgi:hypothetical protein